MLRDGMKRCSVLVLVVEQGPLCGVSLNLATSAPRAQPLQIHNVPFALLFIYLNAPSSSSPSFLVATGHQDHNWADITFQQQLIADMLPYGQTPYTQTCRYQTDAYAHYRTTIIEVWAGYCCAVLVEALF